MVFYCIAFDGDIQDFESQHVHKYCRAKKLYGSRQTREFANPRNDCLLKSTCSNQPLKKSNYFNFLRFSVHFATINGVSFKIGTYGP